MKKLWLFIFLICASTAWADNDFTDTIDLEPARIVNISVEKDCVEITYRQESSGWVYCNGESPPAKIWKDIYVIKDGQIVFDRNGWSGKNNTFALEVWG